MADESTDGDDSPAPALTAESSANFLDRACLPYWRPLEELTLDLPVQIHLSAIKTWVKSIDRPEPSEYRYCLHIVKLALTSPLFKSRFSRLEE